MSSLPFGRMCQQRNVCIVHVELSSDIMSSLYVREMRGSQNGKKKKKINK